MNQKTIKNNLVFTGIGQHKGTLNTIELFPADDEIGRAADAASLAEAVNRLPAEFKEVVLLHYYQGYGISDIAQITGVPEGTVSSRLSRGRKRLEKVLGEGSEQA